MKVDVEEQQKFLLVLFKNFTMFNPQTQIQHFIFKH